MTNKIISLSILLVNNIILSKKIANPLYSAFFNAQNQLKDKELNYAL